MPDESSKRQARLTDIPAERFQNASMLAHVNIPPQEKPVVGITYLEIEIGSYSLKELAGTARAQRGARNIYKELADFLEAARGCDSIQQLIGDFTSRNGLKNKDKASQKKMAHIQKMYHVDTTEMVHLHCKRNGKGAFVLHGFIIRNRFEIVWLDPLHKVHSE